MMTRKEKELKMIESLGLKIGDKVKLIFGSDNTIVSLTTIVEKEERLYLKSENEETFNIDILIREDWVKIKPPLKDMKCKDFKHCKDCPLSYIEGIECGYIKNMEEKTIEEIYNDIKQSVDKAKKVIFGEEND